MRDCVTTESWKKNWNELIFGINWNSHLGVNCNGEITFCVGKMSIV